ncbi:transcription factor MYB117-like [Papaver somniferum]|uniref:transcription factor MYB117-like n=1 Tax=Papaver somniferum TaxID=3469 RepID=UPI000E6FAF80|nr:transcription factor MYB117-like [Papaver somniferum]
MGGSNDEQNIKSWSFQTTSEETATKNEMPCNADYQKQQKSEIFGHGSNQQSTSSVHSIARGHWRPAEDSKLKELVSQYGKSCRLRWFNQLDPRINRRAFSEEEEERLLAAYGNRWAMITLKRDLSKASRNCVAALRAMEWAFMKDKLPWVF